MSFERFSASKRFLIQDKPSTEEFLLVDVVLVELDVAEVLLMGQESKVDRTASVVVVETRPGLARKEQLKFL
jgi:hypothetical protein